MKNLEGTKAVGFCLAGSDGKEHCLADYRGKIVVIYFYPKDNTPGCTIEACTFRDLYKGFLDKDVVLFGVSRDSLASHDNFIAKFNLPFVLLSDPETSMLKAYNAFGEKTSYGKITMGTIRSTVVVSIDGTIIKHWPTVKKAETHPQDVWDYLSAL
ncbi:MAG: peroxiredoxin [Proteobacteria bacterium]|nr:peroxiredoxin [Pseudomonadota bacterium]MBU1710415.1 peroxiredoxin [Pseudomonadota bacterium]